MGLTTAISWTDATWNVGVGCTKVDADCLYCYMYRESLQGTRYNPKQVRKTTSVFHLPLRLKQPSKIFTSSLTDFFHPDLDEWRHECWDIIRRCPQHTFQILTKRPERIFDHLPADWGDGYPNVWLGTSIGSNEGLKRLHPLSKLPAAFRFVSFEPLWEQIDMNLDLTDLLRIDWAIIGGETGNDNGQYRYRPCEISWMEEIAHAITSVGNAVWVKQMGTHLAKQLGMSDRAGTNIKEFPKSLQLREFPRPFTTPPFPL